MCHPSCSTDEETEASFPKVRKEAAALGGSKALWDHEGAGVLATRPVTAARPTPVPLGAAIPDTISVTRVEGSSTRSPVRYWTSMLFHMKTITSRKGLDLVSKTELERNSGWKRPAAQPSPSGPRRASLGPPRSPGAFFHRQTPVRLLALVNRHRETQCPKARLRF